MSTSLLVVAQPLLGQSFAVASAWHGTAAEGRVLAGTR